MPVDARDSPFTAVTGGVERKSKRRGCLASETSPRRSTLGCFILPAVERGIQPRFETCLCGTAAKAETLVSGLALKGADDLVSVRRDDFVFREGDDADALYIVKRGIVQVIGECGLIYERVGEGGIVGELAIVDEGTRRASVRAQTRTDLIKVDVSGFLNLVASEPEFSRER
jgi:hypothetical protein